MKNIHILPTDKPSRIYLIKFNNKLGITSNNPEFTENFGCGTQNQHIYITSDEEIKEGDWFIQVNTSKRIKHHSKNGLFYKPQSFDKKIILTTDQELIKDGVQAIDDEFLEWFVKNPSCEEVEVTYDKDAFPYGVKTAKGYGWYKIIIPKEEPKQEWEKHPKWGVRLDKDKLPDFTYVDWWYEGVLYKRNMLQLVYSNSPSFSGLKWKVFDTKELAEEWIKNPITLEEEPKQETLEEVAEIFVNNRFTKQICGDKSYPDIYASREAIVESHILFAKYQAERMYSEEDMIEFHKWAFQKNRIEESDKTTKELLSEWFEQFKKK